MRHLKPMTISIQNVKFYAVQSCSVRIWITFGKKVANFHEFYNEYEHMGQLWFSASYIIVH